MYQVRSRCHLTLEGEESRLWVLTKLKKEGCTRWLLILGSQRAKGQHRDSLQLKDA